MYSPYGPKPKIIQQTGNPDAVSFAQDDHPALSRNMLRDLQTERAKHYEGLISAKDWPDFEKRRGLIHGLEAAISLCQEQRSKLNA